MLLDGSSVIAATEVPGANKYQFRFRRGSYSRLIALNGRSFALTTWRTKPLRTGKTYDVDVRASFDGGLTWCPFGPVCQITTANAMDGGNEQRLEELVAAPPTVRVFPNPSDGSRMEVQVEGAPEGGATVEIVDAVGRTLHRASFDPSAGAVIDQARLGPLRSGLYLVRCTFSTGETVNERLLVR